jgi:transposase
MNTKRIGIDLAKQVFQVHGVDYQDKVVLRKQLRRNQMLSFFATLSPCLIGMEACGGAHYVARELQKARPYPKTDGTTVCEALCEEQ